MTRLNYFAAALALTVASVSTPAIAITLDGLGIPSEGLTLRATQDSPTTFGNATGGGQDSNGGSELNQLFADVITGNLELGINGNLEGNFNKMWIFFDAVDGGENVLAQDNVDNGFNEIQSMAGLTFPAGVTMDHGLRLEVGGGFYGVRFFDLITNTAQDIATGGGAGDLPLAGAGGTKGITFGWDNSNVLGVDGSSAADAATATKGFEFEIDLVEAFNGSQGNINIISFVTSSDATFMSSQVLPGAGTTSNLGTSSGVTFASAVTVPGPVIDGALLGDVDGDGDVDLVESAMDGDGISDFDIIRMNWLETNESFGMTLARIDGDLNENGEVGIEDFREWKNAFNGTPKEIAAAFASLGAVNVPEPASLAIAALAAVAVLAVRRR